MFLCNQKSIYIGQLIHLLLLLLLYSCSREQGVTWCVVTDQCTGEPPQEEGVHGRAGEEGGAAIVREL